jgi:hypothetical protein
MSATMTATLIGPASRPSTVRSIARATAGGGVIGTPAPTGLLPPLHGNARTVRWVATRRRPGSPGSRNPHRSQRARQPLGDLLAKRAVSHRRLGVAAHRRYLPNEPRPDLRRRLQYHQSKPRAVEGRDDKGRNLHIDYTLKNLLERPQKG